MNTFVRHAYSIALCCVCATYSLGAAPTDSSEVASAISSLERAVTSVTIKGTVKVVNHRVLNTTHVVELAARKGVLAVPVHNSQVFSLETMAGNSYFGEIDGYINVSPEDASSSEPLQKETVVSDGKLACSEITPSVRGESTYHLAHAADLSKVRFLIPTPSQVVAATEMRDFLENTRTDGTAVWSREDSANSTTYRVSRPDAKKSLVLLATFTLSKETGHLELFRKYASRGAASAPVIVWERRLRYENGKSCPVEVCDEVYAPVPGAGETDAWTPTSTVTAHIQSVQPASPGAFSVSVPAFLAARKPSTVFDHRVDKILPFSEVKLASE